MSTQPKGPKAVLNLPAPNKALLLYAKKVLAAMTGNPHFPQPLISLADLGAAITALDASETAMGGGKAKTTQRNADRHALIVLLFHELDYVQLIAEQQLSHADAVAVITSAAMFVKKVTKPSKAELSARHGTLSGFVVLVARAAARSAVYYWQWSTDQTNWTSAPDTMKARTTLSGLTPGVVHFFRFRAITPAGLTEWSQVVSLRVQ